MMGWERDGEGARRGKYKRMNMLFKGWIFTTDGITNLF